MPLYTGSVNNISTATYNVSVQAGSFQIRPVRVKAHIYGLDSTNSVGSIGQNFQVFRVASPTYSGTTTVTATPLRQGSVAASAVSRIAGTHGGTADQLDLSMRKVYIDSGSEWHTLNEFNVYTADFAGDVLISPGSALRILMGTDHVQSMHVTWTFEEIRQLSWPT